MKAKFYHGNVGEVYYQIIKSPRNELMNICCIQDFDEIDYDQSRFCRNSKNEIHCFETEEMAIEKLIKWFEPNEIDEEYRSCCNNKLLIRE